jgi:hypothetical protein
MVVAALGLVTLVRAGEMPGVHRLAVRTSEAGSFVVVVPVVARVQGTAFFRTSIDINNNTTGDGVQVLFQLSYTCFVSPCSGFFNSVPQTVTLGPRRNFHQDDLVAYLDSVGALQTGAAAGTIGSMFVQFSNLPVSAVQGSEGSVVARTYNHLDESTPDSPTVGFAYTASRFFDSAHNELIGTARDTKSSPTVAGQLRSNVGVYVTDIEGTNKPLTVVLSFYDAATGQLVGTKQTFAGMQPGEVRQISDLWTTAGIPSTTNQVIIFVDNAAPGQSSPTYEGYVTIIDGQGAPLFGSSSLIRTQDASFFGMECSDLSGCGF